MKIRLLTILAPALLLAAIGCGGESGSTQENTAAETTGAAHDAEPAGAGTLTGEVLTVLQAGRYTYVEAETDQGRVWAAAPTSTIAVGATVALATAMPMTDFHSEALDRDFPVVYFQTSFEEPGAEGAAGMPAGHPEVGGSGGMSGHPSPTEGAAAVSADIAKAAGGYTVAELWAQKQSLAGREVSVRGQVVKYNAGILGRNWIHLRDGTGAEGSNDITVTTDETVRVGDVILITGTAALDRDFGAGYMYELIIEEAHVETE